MELIQPLTYNNSFNEIRATAKLLANSEYITSDQDRHALLTIANYRLDRGRPKAKYAQSVKLALITSVNFTSTTEIETSSTIALKQKEVQTNDHAPT